MSDNVLKILTDHLEKAGLHGLVNPDAECGCKLGDLAPCDGIQPECQGAEKIERGEPGFGSPENIWGGDWGGDWGDWIMVVPK